LEATIEKILRIVDKIYSEGKVVKSEKEELTANISAEEVFGKISIPLVVGITRKFILEEKTIKWRNYTTTFSKSVSIDPETKSKTVSYIFEETPLGIVLAIALILEQGEPNLLGEVSFNSEKALYLFYTEEKEGKQTEKPSELQSVKYILSKHIDKIGEILYACT